MGADHIAIATQYHPHDPCDGFGECCAPDNAPPSGTSALIIKHSTVRPSEVRLACAVKKSSVRGVRVQEQKCLKHATVSENLSQSVINLK
jgi:hypothetical protein